MVCWESIWHAKQIKKKIFFNKKWKYLLASSFDNCVDTCLSLVSIEDDDWTFEFWGLVVVDPPENFSKRRRRSFE